MKSTTSSERDPLDPTGWDRQAVASATDWRHVLQDPHPASASGPGPALVGSTGPFATLAGQHALDAGGSATDAVLTTAFTQITLALGSWVSYAGLFGLVTYDAATGTTSTVSAGYGTFAGETDPASIPRAPEPSGRTALVPGFVAGAEAAHHAGGRIAWDRLWSPTRWLLDRGIPVNDHLERLLGIRSAALTRTPEGRALLTPDGTMPRAGDRLRQPALARTIDGIAEHGAAWMHRGPWAERFVELVRREGGRVTAEDLAAYEPLVGPPAIGRFAGHDIATLPAPDTGGRDLLAALERLDRTRPGEPLDDPDALVALLDALDGGPVAGSHSDYVVATDSAGNVAALCHSINTAMWGTSGIVVDGVPVPDPAAFQQPALAVLGPGAHLPMPVEPAIALRDGRPALACSSIGAGLHPATVLGLHRTLALGRSVPQAVVAPLVHAHDVAIGDSVTSVLEAREAGPISRVVDDRFPEGALDAARRAGHPVVARAADDRTLPRGFWGALSIDQDRRVSTVGRTPFGQGPVRVTQGESE